MTKAYFRNDITWLKLCKTKQFYVSSCLGAYLQEMSLNSAFLSLTNVEDNEFIYFCLLVGLYVA